MSETSEPDREPDADGIRARPGGAEIRAQSRLLIAPRGLATTALVALSTLGIGVGSAALIVTVFTAVTGIALDPGAWSTGLLVASGWVLGSGVTASIVTPTFVGGSLDATGSLSSTALGSLLLVVAVAAVLARVRAGADGSVIGSSLSMVFRTIVESVAVSAVSTIATAVPAATFETAISTVIVRSDAPATFVTCGLAVFAGLVLGRLRARSFRIPGLAGFGPALREAATTVVVLAAVFGIGAAVGGTVFAASQGQPIVAVGHLPFVGNSAAFLVALAGFGTIAVGAASGHGSQLTAGDLLDAWGWVPSVAGLVVMVVLAVRIGARRGPTSSIRWERVWQLPVVCAAIWLLLAPLLEVTTDVGGLGLADRVALGVTGWTPLLGAVWAAVLSIGAEYAPRIAALAPSVFSVIAGRRGRIAWSRMPDAAEGDDARPEDGAADDAEPAPTVGAEDSAVAAVTPRARRRFVIGAAGVLGAVLLGGVGVALVAVVNASRTPDAVVRAYVEALAEGNADAAAAIVDPGLPSEARRLLTNEALDAADHLLTVLSVSTSFSTQGQASVAAVLAVDGERFTHTFTVSRGPAEFLVLDTWDIEDPMLVEVSVGADLSRSALLGEIDVPIVPDGEGYRGEATIWLYPGTYTFTASDGEYLQSSPATVSALAPDVPDAPVAWIEQEPAQELADLVLDQAKARVTACATVPTNTDEVCPFEVRRTDLDSITLVQQISALEDLSVDGFQTDTAVIATQPRSSSGISPATKENEFSLYGTIEFEDGEPVLTFERGW